MGTKVNIADPWNPTMVAEWAMKQVDQAMADRWLWCRYAEGAPGWMLTATDKEPRGGGGWSCAGRIQWEDASAVARRTSNAYKLLLDAARWAQHAIDGLRRG